MSAETASSTDVATVYVRLLNEGVDVWRPVRAVRLSDTTYRLSDEPRPEDEAWSFEPGAVVVAESRAGDPEQRVIAVARATQFGERSWSRRRAAV